MKEHGEACVPSTPSLTLPHASTLFLNIQVLLTTLPTLPVTRCSSERLFSGMKWIKVYLRVTSGNNHLSALEVMHMHRNVPVNLETVIWWLCQASPHVALAFCHEVVHLKLRTQSQVQRAAAFLALDSVPHCNQYFDTAATSNLNLNWAERYVKSGHVFIVLSQALKSKHMYIIYIWGRK